MRRVAAEVGHCIAVLKIDDDGAIEALDIMSPSTIDDGGHYAPAESITIGDRAGIMKLKAFLDQNVQALEVP